jgi:hypothetical protein
MIAETDRQQIERLPKVCARKALLLAPPRFEREARDIDLAWRVPSHEFFRFYGELIFALSKPVDVVDLSGQSKFLDLVRREGVLLYG